MISIPYRNIDIVKASIRSDDVIETKYGQLSNLHQRERKGIIVETVALVFEIIDYILFRSNIHTHTAKIDIPRSDLLFKILFPLDKQTNIPLRYRGRDLYVNFLFFDSPRSTLLFWAWR